MPFSVTSVVVAFSSGLLTAQILQRTTGCICDCSPSAEGGAILDLLKTQLDRCGPDQLVIPAAQIREAEEAAAAAREVADSTIAGEIAFYRGIVQCFIVFGVFTWFVVAARFWGFQPRRVPGALGDLEQAPRPAALQDVPRWTPPQGSRARQL